MKPPMHPAVKGGGSPVQCGRQALQYQLWCVYLLACASKFSPHFAGFVDTVCVIRDSDGCLCVFWDCWVSQRWTLSFGMR